METVSVVIPCHNGAAFVAEAIESVLSQSHPPDEVVVVDDGSTDGSAAEIERYGSRVTILSQSNRGASAARNVGVSRSRGTHVGFLDADDVWPRGSLAARLETIRQTGADIAYGRVRQSMFGVGEAARQHGAILSARVAGSMVVSRRVFDQVLFDERWSSTETVDWVSRVEAFGFRCEASEAIVLVRRIHGANITLTNPRQSPDLLAVLRAALARKRGELLA